MDGQEQKFAELDFQNAEQTVQQRQRYQRKAKKASELINYLLARKGYAQTQSRDELNESWQVVVGEQWKHKTQIGNIRRGVLEVLVTNSATLQQLAFKKNSILAALQESLPQNKIRDLKFRVGNIDR